jgi:hypothetical protein
VTVEPPDPHQPYTPGDYQAAVEAINRPTAEIRAEVQRTRRMVRRTWIGLSVAFVAIAAAGVAIFVALTIAHNARIAACHNANNFRAGDLQLWNKILGYNSSAPKSPAQKRTVADFEKFLVAHDKLADCSKVK